MHDQPARDDFDAFYRDTAARTLRYAYALSGDLATAQDMASEAYMRAWLHWRRVGTSGTGDIWVRRVVSRLAIDRWRHLRVRRRHESSLGPPQAAPAPSEDLVVLVTALRRVPAQQREVLVLHYVADRTVAQIAAETGAAEGTVKSWLSRGRAALAAALDIREPTADRESRHVA